jgi:hypothetical protein
MPARTRRKESGDGRHVGTYPMGAKWVWSPCRHIRMVLRWVCYTERGIFKNLDLTKIKKYFSIEDTVFHFLGLLDEIKASIVLLLFKYVAITLYLLIIQKF